MEEDLKILILEDVPFDAELINGELEKSGMKFTSIPGKKKKKII